MDGNDRKLMTTTLDMPPRGRGRTANDAYKARIKRKQAKAKDCEKQRIRNKKK